MDKYRELAKDALGAFGYKGKKSNEFIKPLIKDLEEIALIESGALPELNRNRRHTTGDFISYRPARFITATKQGGAGDSRILVYEGQICGFAEHKNAGGYNILADYR